ncbi:MAG: WecB/TagA/CpsF family glycosyltransferase [Anaerolineales bacterium]
MNHNGQIEVLDVRIDAVNMGQAVAAINRLIGEQSTCYVCLAAVHSLLACEKDRRLLQVFNGSALTLPDGMPLVWLCKASGHQHVSRVYGPDLVLEVCREGAKGQLRHFFLGGADGIPEALAESLSHRFPGLVVAGTFSPPFRPLTEEEDRNLVNRINKSRPDILWVGFGTKKQELWMADHREVVEAPVMIAVGAAFDFLSGSKRQAPVVMRNSGLEWLFRLLTEPKRLWPRYRQYPRFLGLLAKEILRQQRTGA